MAKLTIAQRLWLGLGLILALFAAADLVSLWAANQIDVVVRTLMSAGEERRAASDGMRTNLAVIVDAIELPSEGSNHKRRAALRRAQQAFERALADYTALASTERSRSLAQEAAEGYATLVRHVQELARADEAQTQARSSLAGHQRKADGLLEDMPVAAGPSGHSPPLQKRVVVKEVETKLRTAAGAMNLRRQAVGQRLQMHTNSERSAFTVALAHYVKYADSPAERSWALAARNWYAETERRTHTMLAAERLQQRSLGRLHAVRATLDDLLTESIQPAARAELAQAVEKAAAVAREANSRITRVLLLALVLGALAAFATVRAVTAPLRQLVASSKRIAEGNFSHRVDWNSHDELGELTTAFNEMADKLDTTTVSRGYLEGIVSSMSEALLVVSDAGVIRTANPAAEQLLDYRQGELIGKPLDAIAAEGTTTAIGNASPLPVRLTTQLTTKTGGDVPVAISAVRLRASGEADPAAVCLVQDLRERMAAERNQRQATVVLENTKEGIVLADAQRAIVLTNPAFSEITGYQEDEAKGMLVPLLWAKREDSGFIASVWRAVNGQGQWQGEMWVRRKDGELHPTWTNISTVRDASSRIANFVVVFSDISAIKEAEKRLDYLAYNDALTDLPNRLLLAERLRHAIERVSDSSVSVGVLYLDLDDFKHVNDTLGHEEGDRLLREMARRLRTCVAAKDTVARLGGDEFSVLLEDLAEPQDAARVAETILEVISAPFQLSGLELRMSGSIGISMGPIHGTTSEELLKAADAAMYRAKHGGGKSYQFFSAELTQQAMEQLTLRNALRHPSLHDQLVLHYQPQVALKTGHIVGVEALVRWQHPTRGLLLPGQFVSTAEHAGLIATIDEWVLQTACAQAREWEDEGYPPLRIAVNVSAREIRTHSIVDRVQRTLARTGLKASLLELEVTEGALQVGHESTQVLEALSALGVRLALDDFGVGYSSFASIKSLPFDRLKIDRSFVCDLQHEANDRSIARAIIAMGRSLKLEILAEGVETYAQLGFLRNEGCDEIQGYLLGAPMTADDLDAHFPDRMARLHSTELQLIERVRSRSDKRAAEIS